MMMTPMKEWKAMGLPSSPGICAIPLGKLHVTRIISNPTRVRSLLNSNSSSSNSKLHLWKVWMPMEHCYQGTRKKVTK